MDHVLEGIREHYEIYLDNFIQEHKTGKYKKLSDNPHYWPVKTLIDSMNIIRKYLEWDTIKLSEEVERYIY